MKTKRENTVSKQATLKKVLKCKKTLTPKAGSSLEKAVKNVQEIVKKKQLKTSVKTTPIIKFKPSSKPVKPTIKEKLPKDRGVVYVGHIPHGFYEEQMKDYFQQFGRVTRVRVARSKKTGANRGYGFVEFLHTNVAKIAAETMNNYLMCGRLLKATYIPPDKQHPRYFLGPNWSKEKYPALINRRKTMIHKNKSLSDEEYKTYVKTSLNKLSTLEKKLKSKGFNIKFQPRDVPCTGLK